MHLNFTAVELRVNSSLSYSQVKHVVLINCGANFDIIETLQPEEYVKFYICDRYVTMYLLTLLHFLTCIFRDPVT